MHRYAVVAEHPELPALGVELQIKDPAACRKIRLGNKNGPHATKAIGLDTPHPAIGNKSELLARPFNGTRIEFRPHIRRLPQNHVINRQTGSQQQSGTEAEHVFG